MDTKEGKERVIPERRFTDVERASLDFITAEIEAGMTFASAAATQYKLHDNERAAESEARAARAYLRAEGRMNRAETNGSNVTSLRKSLRALKGVIDELDALGESHSAPAETRLGLTWLSMIIRPNSKHC
jgi:hypothetical protein